jgi:hypothetical protein
VVRAPSGSPQAITRAASAIHRVQLKNRARGNSCSGGFGVSGTDPTWAGQSVVSHVVRHLTTPPTGPRPLKHPGCGPNHPSSTCPTFVGGMYADSPAARAGISNRVVWEAEAVICAPFLVRNSNLQPEVDERSAFRNLPARTTSPRSVSCWRDGMIARSSARSAADSPPDFRTVTCGCHTRRFPLPLIFRNPYPENKGKLCLAQSRTELFSWAPLRRRKPVAL